CLSHNDLQKMRLTKFVHSCLLIEADNKNVLIDPGKFTYDSRLLNISRLPRLDYIVITHEHTDHYNEPLLRVLAQNFPHATIITNNDLITKLRKLKLPNQVEGGSDETLTVFEAAHEVLPLKLPNVMNIGIHIGDDITCPGDSFAFKHTRKVLALPLTGPWGSLKDALNFVVKLKPKVVIPVHDWE